MVIWCLAANRRQDGHFLVVYLPTFYNKITHSYEKHKNLLQKMDTEERKIMTIKVKLLAKLGWL